MISYRRAFQTALMALFILLLTSCAQLPWVKIDKETRLVSNDNFKVMLPVGWMHAAYLTGYSVVREKVYVPIAVNRVSLTRDGFSLEEMNFIRFDAKDALPNLQRAYTANMLPSEAAELLVADLKKSGLESLTVHKNEPATIAGKAGFKLHISRKNARGLRVDRLIYGFGYKSGFYVLSYEAPGLHYFPTYQGAFIEALNSFRLIEQ
jgi:hypothetical protein